MMAELLQSSIEESELIGGKSAGIVSVVTIVHRGIWTKLSLAPLAFEGALQSSIEESELFTLNKIYMIIYRYNRP